MHLEYLIICWMYRKSLYTIYMRLSRFLMLYFSYLVVLQISPRLWFLSLAIRHRSSTAIPKHSCCKLKSGEIPPCPDTKSLRDWNRKTDGKVKVSEQLSQHFYGTLTIRIVFTFMAFKIMISCLLRSQWQIIVYCIYLSKKIVNDAVVQHSTDSSSAEAKAVWCFGPLTKPAGEEKPLTEKKLYSYRKCSISILKQTFYFLSISSVQLF